ncbi:MAG: EAL domain-containing protein, partial [Woeseia sp.]|nr:EAL domain-containing protein [Woeseia sp.]MBT8096595.1 EAL domain-containing protein [Woeseia sp.]NNE59571.1 EAL domain-containing protein [Woeseia sp.]
LSLTTSYFHNAVSLDQQMRANVRRIVLLTASEISTGKVAVLQKASTSGSFGLVTVADRDALRAEHQDSLVDELDELGNVQWVATDFSDHQLLTATRECRRQLLRVSADDVRDALRNGEFFLRYQPKVMRGDSSEWKTTEAEALLRWRHPELGSIGPMEFLPELEAFDMMPAVSEFVLKEAASQLIKWREQGLELNSCINLASSQLNIPRLADTYEQIVKEHGLPCSDFTFEVIEQDIASSDAPHLKALWDLREKGFRISLDDFAAATASLGTLEALPVDEIKIHAAALKRARKSPVAQTILAAVTGLAHNLGISVCAEGVEDQESYEFLDTIGCDKLQGYLISEAVMPELIKSGYSADSVEVHAVA